MSLNHKKTSSPCKGQITLQCSYIESSPISKIIGPSLELLPSGVRLLNTSRNSHSSLTEVSSLKGKELKAMLKTNRKMEKKIENALEFLSTLNQHYDNYSTPSGPRSEEQHSAGSVNSRQMIEEISYAHEQLSGPFVLKIPLTNGNHAKKERSSKSASKKPQTRPELLQALERLQKEIQEEIPAWTAHFSNHKRVIEILEGYKRTVRRLVRIWTKEEDTFSALLEELETLKKSGEAEQFKIPPYFLYNPNKRKRCTPEEGEEANGALTPKKNILKAYMDALGGKDSPWFQTYSYFPRIPEAILNLIQDIHKPLSNLLTEDLRILPMPEINRLSAIAKMLQYCNSSRIALEQFQKGRTRQKISTLQQQRKCLREDPKYSTFYRYGGNIKSAEETVEYPTLEELDYLLKLDITQIDTIINNLKTRLFAADSDDLESNSITTTLHQKEEEFLKLVNDHVRKQSTLIKKIMEENTKLDTNIPEDRIKEYLHKLVSRKEKKRGEKLAVRHDRIKRRVKLEQKVTLPLVTGKLCMIQVESEPMQNSRQEEESKENHHLLTSHNPSEGASAIKESSDSEQAECSQSSSSFKESVQHDSCVNIIAPFS